MKNVSYNLDINSPYSIFNNFARAFPFSSSIYALFFGIIFQNFELIFYCVGHIFNNFSNKIFKQLFFNLDISFFGNVRRPFKNMIHMANNFYDPKYKGHFRGMPSGHAQTSGFFAIYFLCYLYNKIVKYKYLIVTLLILVTIYICYTRVNIFKVHTINQVILGYVIGLYLGYLWFSIFE